MTIDIDELERIVNAGDRYGHNTPGVTMELIAEVRRLREDAERYRWIRDHAHAHDFIGFNYCDGHVSHALQGKSADEQIDAARKEQA